MKKNIRSLYNSSFIDFLSADSNEVLGVISSNTHGDINSQQRDAWIEEIKILKNVIKNLDKRGEIIFEYNIPRLSKRIDVVLLYKGIIFCLEFKAGKQDIVENDIDQVLDYALDLKNFHKLSADKIIIPVLIPTETERTTSDVKISAYNDKIINPIISNETSLLGLVKKICDIYPGETEVDKNWIISPYAPTPTIIEAAKTLYENHSVEDITKHEADKASTDKTTKYIMNVIKNSKENKRKSICFVTGVPGAGKTLVGLDVAIKQSYTENDEFKKGESAVFLSGNGPLVAVLTQALALDNYNKCKDNKVKKNLSDAKREVGEFIQIIHKYRDNMLLKIKNPVVNGELEIDPTKAIKNGDAGYSEVEHVAIFDEAQRSWTKKRIADYLKRGGTYGNKLKVPNFPYSEAEFLIWSLDQREDWATIVCLVGGGQEINTGEAGIGEWIKALTGRFKHWDIYISPNLNEKEYAEGNVNDLLAGRCNVTYSDDLHLKTSLRSFRAEKLSAFVHSLLDFNENAKDLYKEINDNYPIYLTRDITKAKKWLHEKVRGSERTGVLITKESARFKPLGIHVLPSDEENAVHWFLEDKIDTRSSNYLEDAATEIQVQGLELDYTCLLWDADMRYENGSWHFYKFNGKTEWKEQLPETENKQELIKYMLNAYRVLLTRARSGMIICVPAGNPNKTKSGFWEDGTRQPSFYNGTYNYLKSLGIKEI